MKTANEHTCGLLKLAHLRLLLQLWWWGFVFIWRLTSREWSCLLHCGVHWWNCSNSRAWGWSNSSNTFFSVCTCQWKQYSGVFQHSSNIKLSKSDECSNCINVVLTWQLRNTHHLFLLKTTKHLTLLHTVLLSMSTYMLHMYTRVHLWNCMVNDGFMKTTNVHTCGLLPQLWWWGFICTWLLTSGGWSYLLHCGVHWWNCSTGRAWGWSNSSIGCYSNCLSLWNSIMVFSILATSSY